MSGPEPRRRGWPFWLGVGCASAIGAVVLLVGLVAGLAWLAGRGQRPQPVAIEHPLPAPPVAEEEAGAAGSTPTAPVTRPAALRLELEVRNATMVVVAGAPGSALAVEAEFDPRYYALDDEEPAPGVRRITFRRTRESLILRLREMFGGPTPALHVAIPPDAPLDLVLRGRQGGAEVDLGGLWLRNVELDVNQGGAELDFSSPLREPLDALRIRQSMAGASIRGVGRASPRTLEVDTTMGGMELDLQGSWTNDAEVTIRGSMCGIVLQLPDRVRILGLERGALAPPSEPAEVALPTLRFETSIDRGELEIR